MTLFDFILNEVVKQRAELDNAYEQVNEEMDQQLDEIEKTRADPDSYDITRNLFLYIELRKIKALVNKWTFFFVGIEWKKKINFIYISRFFKYMASQETNLKPGRLPWKNY